MPLEARDCAPLNCTIVPLGSWLGESKIWRLAGRNAPPSAPHAVSPSCLVCWVPHAHGKHAMRCPQLQDCFPEFCESVSCDDRRQIHLLTMPPKNKRLKQLAKAREARGTVHEEPALSTPSEEESGEGVTRSSRFRSDGRDDDGSVELVEEAECRPWERREAAEDLYASLEVSLCHGTRCFRRQGEGAALERKASSPTTEPPFEVRGETWDYRGVLQRGSASAATSSSVIRRYFRRTDRLVSAYTGHDGISLTPAEVAYVTRKYSSHRRIPAEELAEIVAGRKA